MFYNHLIFSKVTLSLRICLKYLVSHFKNVRVLSTNIYVNVIDYKINKELHQNKKNRYFSQAIFYITLLFLL